MQILLVGSSGLLATNLKLFLVSQGVSLDVMSLRSNPNNQIKKYYDIIIYNSFIIKPNDSKLVDSNDEHIQNFFEKIKKLNFGYLINISSTKALDDNNDYYGYSKRRCEEQMLYKFPGKVVNLRLPNLFGPGGRINHNSVASTWCYNIANNIDLKIHSRNSCIELLHVYDAVTRLWNLIDSRLNANAIDSNDMIIEQGDCITLGELEEIVKCFSARFSENQSIPCSLEKNTNLARSLYSTYLSYLPSEKHLYEVAPARDIRGSFLEIARYPWESASSVLEISAGKCRGDHYHFRKSEKFYCLVGSVVVQTKNLVTNETKMLDLNGGSSRVFEAVPLVNHSFLNNGSSSAILAVTSSEHFQTQGDDTYKWRM